MLFQAHKDPEIILVDTSKKWWQIVLVIHTGFGYFFAYDAVGALAPVLYEERGITSLQLGVLYSALSIFIFGLVLFGGVLNDIFGSKKLLLFASILTSVGMVIVTVSPSFTFMLLGKIVYGVGASQMYVTCVSTIGKWFSGAGSKMKINITNGFLVFWIRIASFAAFNTLPLIQRNWGLSAALWTSCALCFSSVITAILFAILYTPRIVDASYLHEQQNETDDDSITKRDSIIKTTVVTGVASTKSYLKSLSWTYWALFMVGALSVSSLWTFTSFGTLFLVDHWKYDLEEAARINSLVSGVNAVTAPILGIALGAIGKRGYFAIVGAVILALGFLLFTVTAITPYLLFACLGLAQSILDSVILPSVAIVGNITCDHPGLTIFSVDKAYIGRSSGLVIFAYNGIISALPSIVGVLYELSYEDAMSVFVVFGALTLLCSILVKVLDWRISNNLLDSPK